MRRTNKRRAFDCPAIKNECLMKSRQLTIISLALAIVLTAFGLSLRSALTPRYSRSEIPFGKKRNYKLIVSYPAEWMVETRLEKSVILSHSKLS